MTSQLKCRICKARTGFIGSLGEIGISTFTLKPQEPIKYPLDLVYCPECSLLQLGRETPRELLYTDYWYRSSLNPVISEDLKEIAGLVQGRVHIDIGSNDNTLLHYSNAVVRISVDPSNAGKPTFNDYWENVTTAQADTITAVACLYDLPDPNAFMKNIRKHLKPDGVFIAQLMTLQPMIENNDIGNICHEHIEYYSYKSLVTLFRRQGLEIFKVEENDINGGSYRIFARHYEHGSIAFKEKEYSVEDLKDFFKRIEANKQKFLNWYDGSRNIIGYGASTKANTITQYYGISPKWMVDVNPKKIGKFTTSGSYVLGQIPDWAKYLWVFPYGFMDYFRSKEDFNGKWVTTIPEFRVSR